MKQNHDVKRKCFQIIAASESAVSHTGSTVKYRDKDGLIARRVAEVEVAVGRLEVVVVVEGAV